MITNKKIIFIWAPSNDPVQSHWAFLINYAAGFLQIGYEPRFLDCSKKYFEKKLVEELKDSRTAFFVTIQGFGSLAVGKNKKGEKINLFEFFKKPVISLCGDYPYYQWIHRALSDDHPYRIFLFLDAKIPSFVNDQWPKHQFYCDTFECCTQDYLLSSSAPIRNFINRTFPIIYSGNYRDPQEFREIIAKTMQPQLEVFDEVTNRLIRDMSSPPWQITQSSLNENGYIVDIKNNKNHRVFFWAVNQFVRFTRRKRLLKKLEEIPICYVGTLPPDQRVHKKSTVIGNVRQRDNIKLYEAAQSVIMIPPNFPHGVTERFLNTAARGAIPICPKSPGNERFFTVGQNYLEIVDPFAGINEHIDSINRNPDYFNAQRIETLKIIDEHFRPQIVAQKILEKIRSAGFSISSPT